jgi:mono/diheme cytochrome c family protein
MAEPGKGGNVARLEARRRADKQRRSRSRMLALLAMTMAGAGLYAWFLRDTGPGPEQLAQVELGKTIYAENCAACHGATLQGQPDWKSPRPSGRLPAPPHDATGHTWHHPDAMLFEIVKRGSAAVVGNGYESDMPGFDGILTDDEIAASLAYIRSTWPQDIQTAQAERSAAATQ